MKSEITYFEEPGVNNTEEALSLARERALERNIKKVAVTSIRGGSAQRALKIFKGTDIELIMCTCNGCNGCDRFSEEVWERVEVAGHKVVYTNENEIPFPPAAAHAYRKICQGMKVCVQVSMSLVDQGFVSEGEEIIVVAGTGGKSYAKGWGNDTAIIIEATGTDSFWKSPENIKEMKLDWSRIKEIICMPR